mmetsp:Transcript_32679/g.28939  ORF Transcript_32679/g.28939 Transcript_32679/m.28939 type:complete len:130 (-) Transcript_32679:35-424(-)
MSGAWTTGLFGIFDDLDVFIYGSSNRCLAINNSVILGEGKAVFGLDAEKIAGPFKDAGCIGTDGTFCVNAVVCSILPCLYFLWRGEVRNKFGIEGSPLGDLGACVLCGVCAILQDSRTMKTNGLAYMTK